MKPLIILALLLTACTTNAELAETWATDAVATVTAEAQSTPTQHTLAPHEDNGVLAPRNLFLYLSGGSCIYDLAEDMYGERPIGDLMEFQSGVDSGGPISAPIDWDDLYSRAFGLFHSEAVYDCYERERLIELGKKFEECIFSGVVQVWDGMVDCQMYGGPDASDQ